MSFFIATPVTAVFLLPKYYNSRYFTAYHYFQDRFGLSIRLLASGLFILRVSLWLGAATFAPALALKSVTGLPLAFTILSTGLIATIYTMKGGMKAVIWTDIMQLGVLFGGQLIIKDVAAGKVDEASPACGRRRSTGTKWTSPARSACVHHRVRAALIGGTFLNLVQMATDQVSVQRYHRRQPARGSALAVDQAVDLPARVHGLLRHRPRALRSLSPAWRPAGCQAR